MQELQACAEDMQGLPSMYGPLDQRGLVACSYLWSDLLQVSDYNTDDSNFENSQISIYISKHSAHVWVPVMHLACGPQETLGRQVALGLVPPAES